METRLLGRHGPHFSVIGFGTYAVGGPNWEFSWGPQDDRESVAAIRKALDLGVNWIDTAPVYGLGHSEEVVGAAVAGLVNRPFIATKCGLVWNGRGRIRNNLRPASIRGELEASLRRLQVDVIDLYQCHWPDPATPVEDAWQTMAALQDEGKVRWIGVSNFDALLIERCLKIRHVDSVQPPYSLVHREIERTLLPFCRAHGIGVVVYGPLLKGLLTGHFDAVSLAPDDHRRRDPRFQSPSLEWTGALVERLRPIAAKHNKSAGQLAIAWVLRDHAVTSAIVGGRRPSQVEENVGGTDWQLAADDVNQVERALEDFGLGR